VHEVGATLAARCAPGTRCDAVSRHAP
jgi:hypothetical protein